jgi:hypothetical protein
MVCVGSFASFGRRSTTSGLPLKTDIVRAGRHASRVPRTDFSRLVVTFKMLKKHIPGMRQLFDGCAVIRYNFSVCVEGNLSRGVVTVVSEPELKIDALP